MGKPFLNRRGEYWYIREKVRRDGKLTNQTLQSLGKISEAAAREKLREFKEGLRIEPVHRTIVIDPPWPIDKIRRKKRPLQQNMDYQVQSTEWIKKFPVRDFMHEDGAHVYLWTTHRFLPTALECFGGWGVKYQCVLTWVKNVGMTPYSWMYSTEHVLFGTVGNVPLLRKGLRLDFKAKVTDHSRKPDKFYELVRRASPGPRIDIFSREKHKGFGQYGYEVKKYG